MVRAFVVIAEFGNDIDVRCGLHIAGDAALAARLAAYPAPAEFLAAFEHEMQQVGIAADAERHAAILEGRARMPSPLRLTAWEAPARQGWQAVGLERGPAGFELVWMCGAPSRAEPFHQAAVMELRARPLNRLFAVRTPLTPEGVDALERSAIPLIGWLFHQSRCGSTLVAQALKTWPGVRVVSEPDILDVALTLALEGRDPEWHCFRAVMAALAQPSMDSRGLVVKPDAWHALILRDILRRAPAPWFFLYRDPVEVMVSHAREPGRHVVPGMLSAAWQARLALPAGSSAALADHAAGVLGALCASVAAVATADDLLDYAELPQAITRRIAPRFGLDPTAARGLDDVLAQHSKRLHEAFAPDSAAKRQTATTELRRAAAQWIGPQHAALTRIRSNEEPHS